MIPRPRNTLVLCQLMHQAERKVGGIAVPTTNDCYCEAEIVAVGPGVDRVGGARSDTYDLKPGQIVFAKHRRLVSQQMKIYQECGIPITVDGRRYFLMEEGDIGAILFETRAEYEQYVAEQNYKNAAAGKPILLN
jgi:co-chaperonin GroES (HSP10)